MLKVSGYDSHSHAWWTIYMIIRLWLVDIFRWFHRVVTVIITLHTSILKPGFASAFKPSSLKLIKCNKQWWNSVLPSSLLKSWCVILNYSKNAQTKFNVQTFNVFWFCIWLSCDFLEFPSERCSKIFTVHRIWQDTNFKHEKSRVCTSSIPVLIFLPKKEVGITSQIDFPEKHALTIFITSQR